MTPLSGLKAYHVLNFLWCSYFFSKVKLITEHLFIVNVKSEFNFFQLEMGSKSLIISVLIMVENMSSKILRNFILLSE